MHFYKTALREQLNGQFVPSHTFNTSGSRDIESFQTGPYTYFAVANYEGGFVELLRASSFNSLADFDLDGDVDAADLSNFINALMNNLPAADLNEDTLINSDDLDVFAAAYGNNI